MTAASGLALAALSPGGAEAFMHQLGGTTPELSCPDYANKAVAQNKENIANTCGFTGGRWSNDFAGHVQWCMTVGVGDRWKEHDARKDALAQCASKAQLAPELKPFKPLEVKPLPGKKVLEPTPPKPKVSTPQLLPLQKVLEPQVGSQVCSAYAGQAVAQQDNNAMMNCGFTGGRWSNDFDGHFRWCQNATSTDLKREHDARRDELAQCAQKPKLEQQACQAYASEAVAQQKANARRGCGLGGGAWSEDFAAHFGWCLTADAGARASAMNARNQQLAGCVTAQAAAAEAAETAKKDACAGYAQAATQQQAQNLARQCGFAGGSWSDDWSGHFQWCLGVDAALTRQEHDTRQFALGNECVQRVCTTEDLWDYTPPFYHGSRTSCRDVPK
jgi:hypothetical protein